ncbi:MAG TPA: recombinase RecB [Pyrodictium sp.]|nr:recombinase RecB [Pyrodictium sp.]
MEVIVVIHDISSAQRLIDMARLTYSMGYRHFVASRVYGAAATNGVPEVHRLALRLGTSFAVLSKLSDVIELFNVDKTIIFSYAHGERREVEDIVSVALKHNRIALVFGGSEGAPRKDELGLGTPVYYAGANGWLGPVAEAAIILYALKKHVQQQNVE